MSSLQGSLNTVPLLNRWIVPWMMRIRVSVKSEKQSAWKALVQLEGTCIAHQRSWAVACPLEECSPFQDRVMVFDVIKGLMSLIALCLIPEALHMRVPKETKHAGPCDASSALLRPWPASRGRRPWPGWSLAPPI